MEGGARRATLEQDSGAQGALLAIDNTSGDVLAMVGGRDYALSEYNRATQAERQTGSSFKPYVYTAAIEDGAKPSDIIVDGPVSFGSYHPHNYENNYMGPITLTTAFADSRNIPALKLAARVGIQKVIDMAHRFGVTSQIPPYLPIALGAVDISLEEQVASYAVFPNDGIRVAPRLIRKVSNADGITLWQDNTAVNEVIDQHTARTMMTLLRAVAERGTGAAAAQLKHPLGGKTGTTSDFTDAWFLGFSPSVTCGVWVGYDSRESLGDKETGAVAALPIWINFMRAAIAGKADEQFPGDEKAAPMERAALAVKAPCPILAPCIRHQGRQTPRLRTPSLHQSRPNLNNWVPHPFHSFIVKWWDCKTRPEARSNLTYPRQHRAQPQHHRRQGRQPRAPRGKRNIHGPHRRSAHALQQEGQKVPRVDVNVVPRVFVHRIRAQPPRIHLSQREGNHVLEAQKNHKGRMPESLHLVELQRQPERHRCGLHQRAEGDQRHAHAPHQPAHIPAMAQQQRNGQQRRQLRGG